MKVALSQIHLPIGDLEAFQMRARSQLHMAESRGADLIAFPAPLICGSQPGTFAGSSAYQTRLVDALHSLSSDVQASGVHAALVPAPVAYGEGVLFETFYLRNGRVIPLRLLASQSRMKMDESADPWAPICFDLDGLRIALSFDLNRDIELLPPGTDACLYFQLSPFSVDELSATLGAGSCISQYRNLAEQHRIWIACMAPVGLYDSDLYVGGSFVLDDSANIIASAALFEQDLLVCDFGKISGEKPSTSNALESISSSELLWGALRRSVTDFVESFDARTVLVELDGSVSSALVAALAADALGSRRVVALAFPTYGQATAKAMQEEATAFTNARAEADTLHIRYVEHSVPDSLQGLYREFELTDCDLGSLYRYLVLESYASRLNAVVLSSYTKTDYALGGAREFELHFAFAPFGDLYLSELAPLVEYRNRVSEVVPVEAVSMDAINRTAVSAVDRALTSLRRIHSVHGDLLSVLEDSAHNLDADTLDTFLKEHIAQGKPGALTGVGQMFPELMRALCFLVQSGASLCRRMPAFPCVSSSPLAARTWPLSMNWLEPAEGVRPDAVKGLVDYEMEREERRLEDAGQRARQEIAGLIGQFLGLHQMKPDDGQDSSLESDEATKGESVDLGNESSPRYLEDDAPGIDLSSEEAVPPGFRMGGPFFSVN
ncbi:hypothetical protein E4J93_02560 [Collinsella sp. BA40]|uniref:hypothetical protein n=1 Tax=Collinsella sp. BA40 TaxID=2560852 RepID=UPI0011C95512|nr:hypothetical protein [Collinsella sp. BA40]TXF37436.1 hypothetical protein E4J93_02560 [Collinsella sp. BA40]